METNELNFLKVQPPYFDKEFNRIAKKLFNEYCIRANDKKFDIIEIEFYYHSVKENHSDPFIYDKNEKNLYTGNWLFHYSGVDLTFGDKEKDIRGGILIRAIQDGKDFVIGPLRTMVALLNECPSMKLGKNFQLRLEPKDPKNLSNIEPDQPMIRKGLDKAKCENHKTEAAWKYRFIKSREEIKEKSKLTPSQFKQYYG